MSQGGWGEGKRQRAGHDGKGKERKRLLLFVLGYSAGVSADETRERDSNPLNKNTYLESFPPCER